MRATFAPCCGSTDCAGVMLKMDSEVATFLLIALHPERFGQLAQSLTEEGRAMLPYFAHAFAEDVAETMANRLEGTITRLGVNDLGSAKTEEEIQAVYENQSIVDFLHLFRQFRGEAVIMKLDPNAN